MLQVVLSCILQDAKDNDNTKTGLMDIQALNVFRLLETLLIPSAEFDCIFQSLRSWEVQLGIVHRWDVEPSGVFLITRIFAICHHLHLSRWAAMAMMHAISRGESAQSTAAYQSKHLSCSDAAAMDQALRFYTRYAVSVFMHSHTHVHDTKKGLFSPTLLQVPDYVCIQSGWQIVHRDNLQYIRFCELQELQTKVIEKWKQVSRLHLSVKKRITTWWQKRKTKRILTHWNQCVVRTRQLSLQVVVKWKGYVSSLRVKRKIVQSWIYFTLQQKRIRSYAFHWLSKTRRHIQEKWERIRPFARLWKQKVILTQNQHISPYKGHSKILSLQTHYQMIIFTLRIIIPCLSQMSQAIGNRHFHNLSSGIIQNGFRLEKESASLEEYEEFGIGLIFQLESMIVLIRFVCKLHWGFQKFNTLPKLLRVLKRSVMRYLIVLRMLPKWLLTWELQWKMVREQRFHPKISFLQLYFDVFHIPLCLRDYESWNKSDLNILFYLQSV